MQTQPQSVELDMANFTDVPALLETCLLSSAIGLVLIALTTFFHLRKFHWFFWPTSILTFIWYLLLTFGIARFGILWPTKNDPEVIYGSEVIYGGVRHIVTSSRAADFVYLVAWYAVSILLAMGIQSTGRRLKT